MLQTVEQSRLMPIHYASPSLSPLSNTSAASSSSSLNSVQPINMTIANHHHILIVTGPAGCGKSTVAKYLAERYRFEYIEGDDVSHTL